MFPWQQNFGMTTIGSLSNDDGDGNENGKKAEDQISKTTTLRMITLFCTFLSHRYTTAT